MKKCRPRILVAAGLLLSGAYLCANSPLGCGSFAAESAIASFDMCFIFDCTGGGFGGLIDWCTDVDGLVGGSGSSGGGGGGAGGGTADELGGGSFFTDCPTAEDGTG